MLLIDKLFIISMVATWIILFYHIFLTFGGYRHFVKTLTTRELDEEKMEYPTISILIPAHNEEMVIGRTVEAMARLIYPKDKLEIIVINDNSSDRTGEILEEKCRTISNLKVLKLVPPNCAMGKSNALNQGFAISKGQYIVIYDADNTPERRAVLYLSQMIVRHPELGAVVGKFRTRNKDVSWLTRFINIETLSFQWLLQAGRCHFFGLTTIPGTNFIIRRSLIEQMGGWNIKALTEDTEVTVRIYESGYKIYWLPHAVTWEQEPETLKVWSKQRTRWAMGNMWVMGHYFINLFKIHNQRMRADVVYFTFTYFVFFWAVVVSDVIFILGLLGISHITLSGPFMVIWLLAYVLFVAETYMSLSLESGEGNLKNFLLTALMYFTYSQLWIVLVVKAGYLLIKRWFSHDQTVHWYKTERSSR